MRPAFKADRDVVDQRALIGERLGARDMAVDPARMGRGEDLFGRNVRIAGDSVLRRRRAALPVVTVGEADGEIRSRAGIMERVKFPRVQPFRPSAERRIVRGPGLNRIGIVDAGSGEDRLRQPADGDLLLVARKDPLRPRGGRIGDDVPVDVEAGDLLERRLVGDRIRLVGARDLGRVFLRQQHRIVADDGEPRGVGGESLADAFIEPARRAVEARVGGETVSRERDLFVGEDRRHQACARLVGLGHDAPRQRQRRDRRGQETGPAPVEAASPP